MKRYTSLPIDEQLVEECETLIRSMNRSERRRVHRTLLDEAHNADDKTITDNANICACRLPADAMTSLLDICTASDTNVSSFARRVLLDAIDKEMQ